MTTAAETDATAKDAEPGAADPTPPPNPLSDAEALERAKDRLVFALDIDDPRKALDCARHLKGRIRWIKVGSRLYTETGPSLLRSLSAMGFRVFLDLKFHDIPDQVAGSCRAAARTGAGMMTVHAVGGQAMLEAAVRGAKEGAEIDDSPTPVVLAVTILTSLDSSDLASIGFKRGLEKQVVHLAELARDTGCGGVVASPQELTALRPLLAAPFGILTPGIRPAGADKGDQRRVMTPEEAVALGADWLVVGRPIRDARDRGKAADAILAEMARGEQARAIGG